ncbi:hypothetical protein K435DRAFT_809017 [Dendrothele bispora CBS 962.96]|uniref:Uncharacterized protein n=1 Tax=Dendrothele bispora (strain CBS 962.96) TaxID=1314807 RepID=A0A4V6T506_DENBC|nr:hypothetical protein K435DRAFT_809017 [Dendrothele bispora CBS 962.96]
MHRVAVFFGLVVGAAAQVSLYVPGFDPQPLSAVAVGVDGQGRTTWELSPGSITNSDQDIGLIGTATLVEGSQDAQLTYANTDLSLTLGVACTFSGDQAICTAAADGTTVTESETISQFVVQAVTTGISSPSSTPGASHTTGTSGSSPAPSPTTKDNSASSVRGYASYAAVLGGLVCIIMGGY